MTRRNARDRPHDGDPHNRAIVDDRPRRYSKVRDVRVREDREIRSDDRRAGARLATIGGTERPGPTNAATVLAAVKAGPRGCLRQP